MSNYEIKNKNRLNVHTVVINQDFDEKTFDVFLKEKSSRLVEYFNNLAVVIDIEKIKHEESIKETLASAKTILESNNMIVIGVTNNKESLKNWITDSLGLATLQELGEISDESDKRNENVLSPSEIIKEAVKEAPKTPTTKVVLSDSETEETEETEEMGLELYHGIVRGGQRLYARKKHLVVIGEVKPNGEVIADGNLIVIGKLSGKAIAGAMGDLSAVITANDFSASMISIAGSFRPFEENSESYGKNKILSIEDNKLKIEQY